DATVLWLLGAPDQALAWVHDALRLAQELAYPLSMEFALSTAMYLHQLRRAPHTQTRRDHIGARCGDAEVHRLRAELLSKQALPDATRAETCFLQALAVA